MDDLILRVFESYRHAVFAKDAEALLALYDPEVSIFDMWGRWSSEGIGPWRESVLGWFGSLGDERVAVDVEAPTVHASGDLAVATAILTYRALSESGAELRRLSNRITIALRRRGHAWRIFHEHTSAPIDHGTLKAILRR